MCEIKGNKVCSFHFWKSSVWQSHKIKWNSSSWKLKDSTHGKSVTFIQKKKMWFRQSAAFAIIKNKYKWNSSANKTEPSKGKTEKQVYETYINCLKFQGAPIRKDSHWTIKGQLNLAHDVLRGFPNSSLREQQVAISRVSNKITNLWSCENIDKNTVQNWIYSKYIEATPLITPLL